MSWRSMLACGRVAISGVRAGAIFESELLNGGELELGIVRSKVNRRSWEFVIWSARRGDPQQTSICLCDMRGPARWSEFILGRAA